MSLEERSNNHNELVIKFLGPQKLKHSLEELAAERNVALSALLRRNFDVYMTLVNDQQIDCVVRLEKDSEVRYLDIQIKARSADCEPSNAGRFAAMAIRKRRENFFFIFYSEQADTYWIIP